MAPIATVGSDPPLLMAFEGVMLEHVYGIVTCSLASFRPGRQVLPGDGLDCSCRSVDGRFAGVHPSRIRVHGIRPGAYLCGRAASSAFPLGSERRVVARCTPSSRRRKNKKQGGSQHLPVSTGTTQPPQ